MTDISGSNTVSDGYNKPYTPTTEEVRQGWRTVKDGKFYVKELPIQSDEFDRWLAEVKRKAKEVAWYEGASDATNYALNGAPSLPENPYEKEEK